jgi:hypothetical protein
MSFRPDTKDILENTSRDVFKNPGNQENLIRIPVQDKHIYYTMCRMNTRAVEDHYDSSAFCHTLFREKTNWF